MLTEVSNIERSRLAAQVTKDTGFLSRIMAEDASYTHANGVTDTKKSFLETLQQEKLVYDSIAVEDIQARAYNNKQLVVLNGKIKATIHFAGGAPFVLHLTYTAAYTYQPLHGWQMVLMQSTKLPG